MKIAEYLQNQTGFQNNDEPSLLFSQSNKNAKFPDIYLFSNFGYCTANAVNARSEITSHYTEENISVQDHWALPPIEYTLSGNVGEVVYLPPVTWSNWVQEKALDFLQPLNVIAPTVSNYTQGAINVIQHVEATVQRYGQIARQIYSSWGGNPKKNTISNQQYIYEKLLSLRNSRELVTVYTPYGEFHNMAITGISMKQQDTPFQSSLEVKLQQWQYVSTLESRQATETEKALVVSVQKQPEENNAYSGKKELTSQFYRMYQNTRNQ